MKAREQAKPKLDVTRLMTLRALARSGTMASAADRLNLTPSAISQQLSQLERECGVPLLERRGRKAFLTPAGNLLVTHAERIMHVLEEAVSDLEQLRDDIAGDIRVAAFSSVAVALLPETVSSLGQSYPRLQVTIEEMEPQESLIALDSWLVDVAVVDDLAVALDDVQSRYDLLPLTVDKLYVLLPSRHRLCDRQSLALADLRSEAWALDLTSSSFGDFIKAQCQMAGYSPRINAHCTGFEMVAAMVASGCSISIVSGLRLAHCPENVIAIPLQPEIRRTIMLAYRKGRQQHPAIQAVVQQAQITANTLLAHQ